MMSTQNNNHEKLERAIKLREQRRAQWEQQGERPLWQNLSMIGALGWLVITPTLIGVFVGRYLDDRYGTGTLFSGAMIFLGICFGSYLAWQRLNKS